MTTAGEINVKLGLNSDEFVKSLEQSENELKALEKQLKSSQRDFEYMSKAMAMTKNPTKEMSQAFNELKTRLKVNQSAFNNFNNRLQGLQGNLGQTNPIIGQLTGSLTKLAGPAAAIAAAKKLYDLGKAAVDTASKFEQLSVSFEVLAGGAAAGKKLTDQIIELASTTPLTTEALSDGARTLLSFGEASDEVVNDLKLLGDITGGDVQRMQSLTLAFAQVGSTGRLMGQDLLQMINAGFNPLSIMSEKTGKSIGQLKDEMSKGLITFNDVKQAMIDATSEGGRFYGMMNKQSETLEGRLSTLSDNWQLVSKNIGDVFLPMAKAAVNALVKLSEKILHLQNRMKEFHQNLTMQSSSSQLKMSEGLQKQANRLLELADEYEKKGNQAWANSYRKKAAEYEAASKRMLATYEETINKEQALAKKEEKTGFAAMSTTGTTSTGSTKQNKALDAYKKYIDEYNKLNNDYQATLKAREYIENTLKIDPIREQQNYDQALNIYKSYFAKMQEISMSGVKNKAEIQKLEEENLANQLQELRINKELETQRKIYEISQGYQTQTEQIQNQTDENAGFLGGLFGEGYAKRLELEKWYQEERQKIIKASNDNIELQEKAFADLEILRNQKAAQDNLNTWQQYGSNVSSILNSSFSDIISGNETFSDAMKSLMSSLYQELIKMALDAAIKEIEIEQMKQLALKALRGIGSALGGFFGGIGGAIGGIVGGFTGGGGGMMYNVDPMLPTYHSGGVVPGTKEQLAVLKGGERILNPSENAAYTNNLESENPQGSVNNIMMFNIKAWDGKDVIQTLKANSQTINQIVSSGIKNNNQGLRTTVQNI